MDRSGRRDGVWDRPTVGRTRGTGSGTTSATCVKGKVAVKGEEKDRGVVATMTWVAHEREKGWRQVVQE